MIILLRQTNVVNSKIYIDPTTAYNTTYVPTTSAVTTTVMNPIQAIENLFETDTVNQTQFLTTLDEFVEQFYSLPESYIVTDNIELFVIKRNASDLRRNGTSLIQFSQSTVNAIDVIEDSGMDNSRITAVLLQIKLQMNQTKEIQLVSKTRY